MLNKSAAQRRFNYHPVDVLKQFEVIKRINTLSSAFFWHGSSESGRGAKVKWEHLNYPKKEGGLGLWSLASWNNTCGIKLIWMLYFRAGSIWVAWIRTKYLSHSPFWALNEKNNRFSWMFLKLLKLTKVVSSFNRIKIGNGDDTFFWWDSWTPFGSLIDFLGSDGPSTLGIPLFNTISDVISFDS
ncbi:unnamed protein product [Arabis nemorensis]|uniref:Reverse transcriptase zinc-binding domain-containing protein n=1 Tax=Arabis nemorensis TaxID=586526 RepID=A0A565AXP9_9BRAS|nr:unnamed protein product [Arabis nemorensis]